MNSYLVEKCTSMQCHFEPDGPFLSSKRIVVGILSNALITEK